MFKICLTTGSLALHSLALHSVQSTEAKHRGKAQRQIKIWLANIRLNMERSQRAARTEPAEIQTSNQKRLEHQLTLQVLEKLERSRRAPLARSELDLSKAEISTSEERAPEAPYARLRLRLRSSLRGACSVSWASEPVKLPCFTPSASRCNRAPSQLPSEALSEKSLKVDP